MNNLNPFIRPHQWTEVLRGKMLNPHTLTDSLLVETRFVTKRFPDTVHISPRSSKKGLQDVTARVSGRSGSYDPNFARWVENELLKNEEGVQAAGRGGSSDDDMGPRADDAAFDRLLLEVLGIDADGNDGLKTSDVFGVLGLGGGLAGLMFPDAVGPVREDIRIDADFSRLPMLPWHDDDFIDYLRTVPNQILNLFVFQLVADWDYLCGKLMEIEAAGKWDDMSQKSGLSYEMVQFKLPTILFSLSIWGKNYREGQGDVAPAREAVLNSILEMRFLIPMITNFLNDRKKSGIIAEPSSQKAEEAESDIGKKPAVVYVAMDETLSYPFNLSWISRLAFIQAQIREFPDVKIVISVDAEEVQHLHNLLSEHLRPEEFKNVHFVIRPPHDAQYRHDSRISWARDGLLLYRNKETGNSIIKANEALYNQAPHVLTALAAGANVSVDVLPLSGFEGGNHNIGQVALVGSGELPKNKIYTAFDPEATLVEAKAYADLLGKKVILVGDMITGQTIKHIDMYMSQLPDGTVIVTDFRKGWEILKVMSDDQLDKLVEEHENDLAQWISKKTPREEESDILASLVRLFKSATRDEAYIAILDRWVTGMSETIDNEISGLEEAGLTVRRIVGFPVPGIASGLGYANVVIQHDDSEFVMFAPSYGKEFDELARKDYRDAGFQGRIVFIPGMVLSAALCGGTARCVSFIVPETGKADSSHPWLYKAENVTKLIREIKTEESQRYINNIDGLFFELGGRIRDLMLQAIDSYIMGFVGKSRRAPTEQQYVDFVNSVVVAHYMAHRFNSGNIDEDIFYSSEYWHSIVSYVGKHGTLESFDENGVSIVMAVLALQQQLTAKNRYRKKFVATLFQGDARISSFVNQGIFAFRVEVEGVEWFVAFPEDDKIWFSANPNGKRLTYQMQEQTVMTRINKSLEDPFLVHVQEIAFSPKSRLPERIFSRKDLHGKFTE